ncbi:MAG: hypothetical protein O3A57_11970 [Bacteroidetes bacterium]|nr:hypothetical protein [Bacteroidota bacterium]
MEILAGGPFQSGELVAIPEDWSILTDEAKIEMQTMNPARSRTMWLVVYDNRLFIISSYMNSPVGKIWKQWPHQIKENNLAIVRAQGKLYELQLIRHNEGSLLMAPLSCLMKSTVPGFRQRVLRVVMRGCSN